MDFPELLPYEKNKQYMLVLAKPTADFSAGCAL
jgi:hypothetical protein